MKKMANLYKHLHEILFLQYLYFVNCQSHMENVALSGTCNMTDTFNATGNCTYAIDNVTDLELRFTYDDGGPNCIHSIDSLQAGGRPFICRPFWQVILQEDYMITNITIYNRATVKQRLTYTDVTVNNTLCKRFGSDVSTIQDVNTFQCSSPLRGRTVTVSRYYPNCTSDGDYTLNLCEVQVWVCSKGWYGNDCNTPCSGHCSNNATCDRYNGSCLSGCIRGWQGSRCDTYTCQQNCVGACNQSSSECFDGTTFSFSDVWRV